MRAHRPCSQPLSRKTSVSLSRPHLSGSAAPAGPESHSQQARLWDFREDRDPMSQLFNRLLESTAHREDRQAVEQTVREQRASLRDEGERAAACLDVTHAAGAELRGRLQDEGCDAPPAGFTPKQIVQFEMYAVRHH